MKTTTATKATTITEHNERRARRLINNALRYTPNGTGISARTARLIAATIHAGPYSALWRFATTGYLDAGWAATELAGCKDELPAEWLRALDEYLRQEVPHGTV